MKKNSYIYIISFLFAAVLWVYLNLNLTYTVNLKVPLKLQLLKNQALSEELPEDINLTLRGRGWDLMNVFISKNTAYNLDLTNVKRNTRIITGNAIAEKISIPFNITVLGTEPDTLFINFDNVSEKYVKVKSDIQLELKDDYRVVGEPQIFPDSVKIRGAYSVISKIKEIYTERKVIRNVNSNVSQLIAIKDNFANLVTIEPKQVEVKYNVELSAEKNFDDLNIEILNLPPDKEVILIPPKLNLSLRGGVESLSKLTAAEIRITVDYSKIEKDTLGYVVPDINLPGQVSVVKIFPSKFDYIIKTK